MLSVSLPSYTDIRGSMRELEKALPTTVFVVTNFHDFLYRWRLVFTICKIASFMKYVQILILILNPNSEILWRYWRLLTFKRLSASPAL